MNPKLLFLSSMGLAFPMKRIGLEAGPLSQWLHAGSRKQDLKPFCWRRACEGGIVSDDG